MTEYIYYVVKVYIGGYQPKKMLCRSDGRSTEGQTFLNAQFFVWETLANPQRFKQVDATENEIATMITEGTEWNGVNEQE